MKANISLGIGIFIAVAAFYVILTSLPLVFQSIGSPLGSIEPEPTAKITTTTIPVPDGYAPEAGVTSRGGTITRNGTAGTGKTSTPLQELLEKRQDQAVQQAEQLLEKEVESAIGNQTDEGIPDLITGAVVGGL